MPDKQYPPYSGPKTPYTAVDLNFAGVQGNDSFSIHTPQGAKWMKVGQEVNGYLISGYNPKTKELQVSQKGRLYNVPMNAGTPTEYVPPSSSVEHPYTTDPSEMISFDDPEEDPMTGHGTTSNWEQQFANIKEYKFKPEEFDTIWKNSQKSTYMTKEQKDNIYSLDAYQKRLSDGGLKPDTDYYIPRKIKGGGVDFDIFRYNPDEGSK